MGGKLKGRRRALLCAAGLLISCAAGCIVEGPLSVRRTWFDYNTLKTPAFYYEKIHHMPPDSARVKQMRWMYGKSPGREDLPLDPCRIPENCPDGFPPDGVPADALPPSNGYTPLPPLPGAGEMPKRPTEPGSIDHPPAPAVSEPQSTAQNRANRRRTPRRVATNRGAWRFPASR